MLCSNECVGDPDAASDGYCDDGGPGWDYAYCEYGTDCKDCGPRLPAPPPPPIEDCNVGPELGQRIGINPWQENMLSAYLAPSTNCEWFNGERSPEYVALCTSHVEAELQEGGQVQYRQCIDGGEGCIAASAPCEIAPGECNGERLELVKDVCEDLNLDVCESYSFIVNTEYSYANQESTTTLYAPCKVSMVTGTDPSNKNQVTESSCITDFFSACTPDGPPASESHDSPAPPPELLLPSPPSPPLPLSPPAPPPPSPPPVPRPPPGHAEAFATDYLGRHAAYVRDGQLFVKRRDDDATWQEMEVDQERLDWHVLLHGVAMTDDATTIVVGGALMEHFETDAYLSRVRAGTMEPIVGVYQGAACDGTASPPVMCYYEYKKQPFWNYDPSEVVSNRETTLFHNVFARDVDPKRPVTVAVSTGVRSAVTNRPQVFAAYGVGLQEPHMGVTRTVLVCRMDASAYSSAYAYSGARRELSQKDNGGELTPGSALCVDGHWPLYMTEEEAQAVSGGSGVHTHTLNHATYWMPTNYPGATMTHGGLCPPSPPPPPDVRVGGYGCVDLEPLDDTESFGAGALSAPALRSAGMGTALAFYDTTRGTRLFVGVPDFDADGSGAHTGVVLVYVEADLRVEDYADALAPQFRRHSVVYPTLGVASPVVRSFGMAFSIGGSGGLASVVFREDDGGDGVPALRGLQTYRYQPFVRAPKRDIAYDDSGGEWTLHGSALHNISSTDGPVSPVAITRDGMRLVVRQDRVERETLTRLKEIIRYRTNVFRIGLDESRRKDPPTPPPPSPPLMPFPPATPPQNPSPLAPGDRMVGISSGIVELEAAGEKGSAEDPDFTRNLAGQMSKVFLETQQNSVVPVPDAKPEMKIACSYEEEYNPSSLVQSRRRLDRRPTARPTVSTTTRWRLDRPTTARRRSLQSSEAPSPLRRRRRARRRRRRARHPPAARRRLLRRLRRARRRPCRRLPASRRSCRSRRPP